MSTWVLSMPAISISRSMNHEEVRDMGRDSRVEGPINLHVDGRWPVRGPRRLHRADELLGRPAQRIADPRAESLLVGEDCREVMLHGAVQVLGPRDQLPCPDPGCLGASHQSPLAL